jgi:hypothetical protein
MPALRPVSAIKIEANGPAHLRPVAVGPFGVGGGELEPFGTALAPAPIEIDSVIAAANPVTQQN